MKDHRDSIDFWVAQTSKLHHARVHARLEGMSLYPGQPGVLFLLWERNGRSQSELAELLRIKPATLAKTVMRMEKSGFITRSPAPDDQRISLVFLTELGVEVQKKVEQTFLDMDQELTQGFNAEERLLLRRLLMHLCENMIAAGAKDDLLP